MRCDPSWLSPCWAILVHSLRDKKLQAKLSFFKKGNSTQANCTLDAVRCVNEQNVRILRSFGISYLEAIVEISPEQENVFCSRTPGRIGLN